MFTHADTRHSKLDKVMTEKQFEEIVAAILDGKYSWACVLILTFAGYNPLHYIPYRTYNRLKKEHRRKDIDRSHEKDRNEMNHNPGKNTQIKDLSHFEGVDAHARSLHGGQSGLLNEGATELVYAAFNEAQTQFYLNMQQVTTLYSSISTTISERLYEPDVSSFDF